MGQATEFPLIKLLSEWYEFVRLCKNTYVEKYQMEPSTMSSILYLSKKQAKSEKSPYLALDFALKLATEVEGWIQ